MSRHEDFKRYVASAYAPGDLRELAHDQQLLPYLPSGAAFVDSVRELIDLWERHGYFTDELLQRLIQDRPKRRAELVELWQKHCDRGAPHEDQVVYDRPDYFTFSQLWLRIQATTPLHRILRDHLLTRTFHETLPALQRLASGNEEPTESVGALGRSIDALLARRPKIKERSTDIAFLLRQIQSRPTFWRQVRDEILRSFGPVWLPAMTSLVARELRGGSPEFVARASERLASRAEDGQELLVLAKCAAKGLNERESTAYYSSYFTRAERQHALNPGALLLVRLFPVGVADAVYEAHQQRRAVGVRGVRVSTLPYANRERNVGLVMFLSPDESSLMLHAKDEDFFFAEHFNRAVVFAGIDLFVAALPSTETSDWSVEDHRLLMERLEQLVGWTPLRQRPNSPG